LAVAGAAWHRTTYVFTTELGGRALDPRNALGELKTAAKRAGLPSSVGLAHTAALGRLGDAVGWRASQASRAPWLGSVARLVLNHAHFPLIVAPASLSDRRVPEVNTA
jgi:hypothetical protein